MSPGARRERGFLTPSLPYLPGSAIRGALAAHWKSRFGDPDDAFEHQVEALRVGPALPVDAEQMPLSVYRCKYPVDPGCARVYDDAFGELPKDRRCRSCGRPLEQSKGAWVGDTGLRTVTRTALTDEQTALSGSLFSRQAIRSQRSFTADVIGDLQWLGSDPVTLRIGGRRTIGGKVQVTVDPVSVESRIGGTDGQVVVRLLSPAVFVGADGRTHLEPRAADLQRATAGHGMDRDRLLTAKAWTRPGSVGGWNAAAGLPKATEVAAMGGSTFIIRGDEGDEELIASALVERGLGLRRTDGLGWVRVDDQPWRPPETAEAGSSRQRGGADTDVAAIADQVDGLRNAKVRRRISGWLRDGFTREAPPPGYAFDGLPATTKPVVLQALDTRDDRRLALLMTLQARDFRGRQSKGDRR